MPEEATTQSEQENAGPDPLSVKAADLYLPTTGGADEDAALETSGVDDDPEDEDEGEAGEAGEEGDEDTESDDVESGDDAVDEDALPRLRAAIEDALSETKPELVKEWADQWKGIVKREQKVADFERGIVALYADLPAATRDLNSFLEPVAKHHGVSVAELLGLHGSLADDLADGEAEEDDDLDEEFMTASEIALKRKFEAQIARLESKVAPLEQDRVLSSKEREAARARAEFDSYVERVAPRTIKALGKLYPGFKATPAMVAQALTKFPSLKDTPMEAVEAAFVRDIARASATLAEQTRGAGRELHKNRTPAGTVLPSDPTDIKAHMVYK